MVVNIALRDLLFQPGESVDAVPLKSKNSLSREKSVESSLDLRGMVKNIDLFKITWIELCFPMSMRLE